MEGRGDRNGDAEATETVESTEIPVIDETSGCDQRFAYRLSVRGHFLDPNGHALLRIDRLGARLTHWAYITRAATTATASRGAHRRQRLETATPTPSHRDATPRHRVGGPGRLHPCGGYAISCGSTPREHLFVKLGTTEGRGSHRVEYKRKWAYIEKNGYFATAHLRAQKGE